MALIKKNSEVPSNALTLEKAELINLTLHELHAKTTVFYSLDSFLPLHKYSSHIFYIFQVIYHETDNENNKTRPLFMVFYQLFHSKQRLNFTS